MMGKRDRQIRVRWQQVRVGWQWELCAGKGGQLRRGKHGHQWKIGGEREGRTLEGVANEVCINAYQGISFQRCCSFNSQLST